VRGLRSLMFLLSLAAASCSRCGGSGPGVDDAAPVTEAAVPAPAQLLADLYVPTPNAAWGRLQRGIGGAVGILPSTFAGVVCTMAGFDVLTADEVDGLAPAYGVVAGDPSDPDWAIAMRLADPRRARIALVLSETSRFSGRERDGMTELVPKGSTKASAAAITKGGYLLIARRPEALAPLGAYAARTLPTRPLPEGALVAEVPRSAIEGIFAPRLSSSWKSARASLLESDERMRRERGGRAPDFGDPKAIVSTLDDLVERRVALLGDLEHVRVQVDVGDDDVRLSAALTPKKGGGPAAAWIAAMTTGGTDEILAMPSASAVALTLRDDEATRAEQAKTLEDGLVASLGDRLPDAEKKRLHDVLDDATRARAGSLTGAFLPGEPGGAFLKIPVRDEAVATRALRSALELVRVAPFKPMLRVRDVSTTTSAVPGVGDVTVARVAREPSSAPPARRPPGAGAGPRQDDRVGLAWRVHQGGLALAAGEDPSSVLRAGLVTDKTLGDLPAMKEAASHVGGWASTVVVAQPLLFDANRAMLPPAPLVLAIGRRDGVGAVHLGVADALLREAARAQMGL
jgi:hypothetical protein